MATGLCTLHVTAGMRGCMGAAKEMYLFLARFKTVGVKSEDGLGIKISVKTLSRDSRSLFLYRFPLQEYAA